LAENIGRSADCGKKWPEISDFWPFSHGGFGVFGRAGRERTKERKHEKQEKMGENRQKTRAK
jgi:hypothetical protein